MADVFGNAPEEGDEDQTPGLRVAGALTGDGEDAPEEEESPQTEQPQGMVDSSARSYLVPAEADEDTSGMRMSATGPISPETPDTETPVSADTKAYMTPIAAPTLAAPKDYADHSADTAAMTAQKQTESQQNIKPSFGRKLLAGIAGGAVAFGGGDGSATSEKVLNRPVQRAQQQWALQEFPLQAKLNADAAADAATRNANANTEQQNRLAETNYRNQSLSQQNEARAADYQAQAEQRKNAITSFTPDDPANPYAGGTGTTADGRTMKGVPPPDKWLANWEKNPDNIATAKANAGVKTLKALEASGVKLTPEQRAIVASGGKITPSTHTSISILENPDGSARTPAGQAGQAGPGEKIAQNMQDKQSYIDSLTENKEDVTDDKGNVLSPKDALVDKSGNTVSRQQFNDRLEKFRTDLNADPVMRKSGTMVDPQGNTVSNRFSRNPTTAPAANTVTPSAGAQPQGMIAPGNVDLSQRPNINNGDGTHSSVFSMSFGTDKGEVLVPGVGDGKTYPLRKLSTAEALDQYKKTGANLGTFKDVASSNAYAQTLHQDQAKGGQSQPQHPVYKAKSGGTVTVGTHVVVAGKPGIVTGFDAKGKPIVK